MGKDIGRIHKHSQSQLSASSIKAPVISSSESQTSSGIKLTTIYVPSITDKHQNNPVLCFQHTIQNDTTITNNDDIQSCETAKNIFNIPTISTHNYHSKRISSIYSSTLTSNTSMILHTAGK